MKEFIMGLMILGLVGCAGYGIQLEDRATGAKINTGVDGEICFDDGRRFGGCIKAPEQAQPEQDVISLEETLQGIAEELSE